MNNRIINRIANQGKVVSILLLAIFALPVNAQTAKQVLDKAAAVVSNKAGAQASFTIAGENMNTSGTIAIKGKKFHATTPQAIVCYRPSIPTISSTCTRKAIRRR